MHACSIQTLAQTNIHTLTDTQTHAHTSMHACSIHTRAQTSTHTHHSQTHKHTFTDTY